MKTAQKSKGTWMARMAIRLFTIVLAVLIFWLLGFIVQDVRRIPGPDREEIISKHVDSALLSRQSDISNQLESTNRRISSTEENLKVISDSSTNFQTTLNQLIELRKLRIEKDIPFPDQEKENFDKSLKLFLVRQQEYQQMSEELGTLKKKRQELVIKEKQTRDAINRQRAPGLTEYNELYRQHRIKCATYELGVLLPILAAAVLLLLVKRTSIYFPLVLALGGATLVRVTMAIHEYFPKEYFKYILIIGLMIAIGAVLLYFIRSIAFPKAQWLVQQYREAYERFLCPVCEYPIRTGPRKYLFWTRRSVAKMALPAASEDEQAAPYTCPSCGTGLMEECESCHGIRHTLLPNCQHCGAEKKNTEEAFAKLAEENETSD